jgi:hypothetical protein
MLYIIDANNLAGKLGLLGCKDFDKMLLVRLQDFFGRRQHRVILIFDSNDLMGDRFNDGQIEVVYTPRDSFYRNADDKVLETVRIFLADENFNEEIAVVTDDLDLTAKVNQSITYHAKKDRVKTERSTEFAQKIEAREAVVLAGDDLDRKELENDSKDLNAELLKIWGKH